MGNATRETDVSLSFTMHGARVKNLSSLPFQVRGEGLIMWVWLLMWVWQLSVQESLSQGWLRIYLCSVYTISDVANI